MSEVSVSVQICTYNRGDMAAKCLEALDTQTFPPDSFEVVLVDDGSDEDLEARLAGRQYSFRLRLLRIPHGGLARARNVGIEQSSGDVLLFVDDDTVPDRRLVEEHWQAHQRHPRAVVLGWVNHVPADGRQHRRRPRIADFSTSFFWTANASVRRDDLRAAGLFDESFTEYGWEDVEMGERLRETGLVRRFNRHAVVSHVKPPWRAADMPRLLRQAEASGRSAVLFVRKRPSRRARLATGVTAWRIAMNRSLELGEDWFRRRVEKAGDGPLRGVTWIAAYLWTRLAYFRGVESSLAAPAS